MTTIKLRYVKAYEDRHGKRRYYFRQRGAQPVALPGKPGSAEFMDAYKAALAGAPKRAIGEKEEIPGSLSALIALYYKTSAFKDLKEVTKRAYKNELERLRAKHGKLPVRGIQRKHVAAMLDQLADKPGAQYNLRRVLRILLTLALERNWRSDHPMVGLRRARKPGEGFRSWTDDDIAKFEAHWPARSRARLALYLLLYTAQRRADVVKMGRQHVKGDKIHVATSKSNGNTRLWIPMHAKLRAELEGLPVDNMTFLMTAQGAGFSAAGFTNWFRDCAQAAGLPAKSSPHGLRKASLRRLAEAGCSANQIMSVSGHKNLSEVTLYTAAADQARLAEEAMKLASEG